MFLYSFSFIFIMKLAFVSRNPRKLEKHLPSLKPYLSFIHNNPEVVIAIGGDGTFLAAERYYPGVPKLLIREQSICNKCDWDNLEEGLKLLVVGKFKVEEFPKITAQIHGKCVEAVNDIVVRNVHPTHAIRFHVTVNGKRIPEEIIGDGIVVSTVYGSEGYFRSITGEHFEEGMGIAFNNTTKNHKPLFVPLGTIIKVEMSRGFAHVVGDNNPNVFVAEKGDVIEIMKSDDVARHIRFKVSKTLD
jgi:NAD kinase